MGAGAPRALQPCTPSAGGSRVLAGYRSPSCTRESREWAGAGFYNVNVKALESMVGGPTELEQGRGCLSRVREADRWAEVRELGKLRFA